MYNSGIVPNWDSSMLDPEVIVNPLGLAVLIAQAAIFVGCIIYCIYKVKTT